MMHRRRSQPSAISVSQVETHQNENLILYRHLHQSQIGLEQESATNTTSREDIHQTQVEDNLNPTVYPHRLNSSEQVSPLPSPPITSKLSVEKKKYNIIEEGIRNGKSRSLYKDNVDLNSTQSNNNKHISKEKLSFCCCCIFVNVGVFKCLLLKVKK
jgi:hypothetical protein